MRTTLDIDDPVLDAAKEIARREGRTAGAVISELARRGLGSPVLIGAPEPPPRHGFRPFAAAASEKRVTNEQVDRLRDEAGI
jgi:hypothetical protein